MNLQLHDKTALVTGSTAGIGFAIASLFAQEGAAVIVNGCSRKRVDETCEKWRKLRAAILPPWRKEFFRSPLLKRLATPEEVAPLIVYVSSPVASATNGAGLRVDGGVVRSIV